MASSANARGIRSKDERVRGLKSSKKFKGQQVTVTTQLLPISTNINTVSNGVTVDSFKEKCPSEVDGKYNQGMFLCSIQYFARH